MKASRRETEKKNVDFLFFSPEGTESQQTLILFKWFRVCDSWWNTIYNNLNERKIEMKRHWVKAYAWHFLLCVIVLLFGQTFMLSDWPLPYQPRKNREREKRIKCPHNYRFIWMRKRMQNYEEKYYFFFEKMCDKRRKKLFRWLMVDAISCVVFQKY